MILLSAIPAHAWNCSDPNAERVNVGSTLPAGATAGDGDGQYYKGSDASNPNDYYVCKVVTPTKPGGGGGSNTNSNTSSSNSSAASSSNSSSAATGGKSSSRSSAQGGNATGGNATSGVSNSGNSVAGISGSGNSTNTLTANGGAGGAGGTATATGGSQKQTQSNTLSNSGNASQSQSSTSSATNNGNGNGNGANNSTYENTTNVAASKIPVASAIAPPVVPTSPCFKGFGASAQTMLVGGSFGGGKVDTNCAILETSRLAPNLLARCKVYITDKYVKAAGVTLDDCLLQAEVVSAPVIEAPAPVVPPQVVVNIPPQPAAIIQVSPTPINIIEPIPAPAVTVHAVVRKKRVIKPCPANPTPACPTAKPTVFTNDAQGRIRNEIQD